MKRARAGRRRSGYHFFEFVVHVLLEFLALLVKFLVHVLLEFLNFLAEFLKELESLG